MTEEKCKWCGSVYIYTLYNKETREVFYDEDQPKFGTFKVLGCSACGKITFIRKDLEIKK